MEETNDNEDMVGRVLRLINRLGTGDQNQKVEFFFYARDIVWAHILGNYLRSVDYEVEVSMSASSSQTYLVSGCTTPMQLEEEQLQEWSELMERLAQQCEAEFDGWGTLIN
ncbi:MAG: ribonuclease E inhibitor RraB [Bacteroidota bacterium]